MLKIQRPKRHLTGIPLAIVIACVVGPILTIINQFEGLFADAPFVVWKAVLTFMVPFCVSMVSQYLNRRAAADQS